MFGDPHLRRQIQTFFLLIPFCLSLWGSKVLWLPVDKVTLFKLIKIFSDALSMAAVQTCATAILFLNDLVKEN